MKRRDFTLLEAIVVIIILVILFVMFTALSDYLRQERQIGCVGNLKQIGLVLSQYETTYKSAPAYSAASAAATTDGKLCAANLTRLYPLLYDAHLINAFTCPLGAFRPKSADATARPETVRDDPDGAKYTSYNLTTCYDRGDPANKIIVADMPFAAGNVTASVHDSAADRIDYGPQCLFKDGHVATKVTDLCPEGSSERDLSPNGNIYRVDGGGGKGKDTCILGVDR